MPKATLLYTRKQTYPDGVIVEMTIWQLPQQTDERPHGLKYRLQCCYTDGTPVVRYDNEHGKGDHRHYGEEEQSYTFTDVDTLIADFIRDVKARKARKRGLHEKRL